MPDRPKANHRYHHRGQLTVDSRQRACWYTLITGPKRTKTLDRAGTPCLSVIRYSFSNGYIEKLVRRIDLRSFASVDPERRRQVENLYRAVLAKAPMDRATFVAESTRGDEQLLREIEARLAHDTTATIAAPGKPLNGTQLGPYRIESLLGEGGMGQVFQGM